MKSMMLHRENDRLHSESNGNNCGSCDEYVDYKHKEEKATQQKNDTWIFNSVSPMNTSDEESVHKSDSCTCAWNTECSECKNKVISQNLKLRRELSRISNKVLELEMDKSAFQKRVETNLKVRFTENARMKDKFDSLQDLVDERNAQVKELLNVIQMLDHENMVLKRQSDKWQEREKQLNKLIIDSE